MMNRSHLEALLRELQQKREACQARIEEHERRIADERASDARLIQVETYILEELSATGLPTEGRDEGRTAREDGGGSIVGNLEGLTGVDAAAAIMEKVGRPMRIGEIIDNMEEEGYRQSGYERSVMYNSLYTSMKKSRGRFHNANGLWTLRVAGPVAKSARHLRWSQANGRGEKLEIATQRPSYVDAAEFVAKQKGGPFRPGDVADWMIEQGHKRPGKRAGIVSTLYGTLKKSPKFRNSGGMWELAPETERLSFDDSSH